MELSEVWRIDKLPLTSFSILLVDFTYICDVNRFLVLTCVLWKALPYGGDPFYFADELSTDLARLLYFRFRLNF